MERKSSGRHHRGTYRKHDTKPTTEYSKGNYIDDSSRVAAASSEFVHTAVEGGKNTARHRWSQLPPLVLEQLKQQKKRHSSVLSAAAVHSAVSAPRHHPPHGVPREAVADPSKTRKKSTRVHLVSAGAAQPTRHAPTSPLAREGTGFHHHADRSPPSPGATPTKAIGRRSSLSGLLPRPPPPPIGDDAVDGALQVQYLSISAPVPVTVHAAENCSEDDATESSSGEDSEENSDDDSDDDSDDNSDTSSDGGEEDPIELAQAALQRLSNSGVRIIDFSELDFGKHLDSGSFGFVREATWRRQQKSPVQVAVKTSAREDDFVEVLELFELEAKMAALASTSSAAGDAGAAKVVPVRRRSRRSASRAGAVAAPAPAVAIAPISHIVQLFGVAISVGNFNIPPQGTPVPPLATALMDAPALHIVMERLVCDGDVHEVIHCDDSWECVRSRGRDTGKRMVKQLLMKDGHDVFSYQMQRSLKIEISLGLARGLRALREAGVLHCDIKPANTVLHTLPHPHPEFDSGRVLKIIDFGEANTVVEAKGDIAGTPGYMSPEMEKDGDASFASDMYSAGVYLIELWAGWIGPIFDEYAGLSYATAVCSGAKAFRKMRAELNAALARLEKVEPEVGALLRRCVAASPSRRPTPGPLIRTFKRLSREEAAGKRRSVLSSGPRRSGVGRR
eukprot:m.1422511 g.1422511  ORF g.1422511 m.1422511 type:complete len:676 (+) comp25050_c2_seq6:303-2330(+)